MAYSYLLQDSQYIRQGEVIYNLIEFRMQIPEDTTIDAIQKGKVDQIVHPYAIVISQCCDLEQDYKSRKKQVPDDKLITHILFCGLFSPDEIRVNNKLKSDLFKRVRQNQDERYHFLYAASIGNTAEGLPDLVADFKNTFSLPTESVYWLVSTRQAVRKCTLPSPYLEDFMHRLYSFLGRVATPTIEE